MKGETNMSKNTTRKDDKGRVLYTGESQKNGRYVYKYKDYSGKMCYVYSNRLKPTDKNPPGKKPDLSLREKIAKIQKDKLDGIIGSEDMTVYELVERYLATKHSVRQSTKQGYKTVMNFLEKEPFARNKISKIKTSDAKLWFIKLQQKDGKGYSTIHTIRGVLRPAFNMAVEDDLIRKNPFQFPLMDVIVNDSKTREALTPQQEREFLRFVQNDSHYSRYYDGFYVLLNTGLRISEFCGLTKKDVDFKNNCIHVRGQLVRFGDMVYHYEPTKTAKGMRDIPMTPEVAQCFKNMWKNRRNRELDMVVDGKSGFFNYDQEGKPKGMRDIPMTPEVAQCFKNMWKNRRNRELDMVVDGKSGFFNYDQEGKPMLALHWEHYCNRIVMKYNETYKAQLPNITPHAWSSYNKDKLENSSKYKGLH